MNTCGPLKMILCKRGLLFLVVTYSGVDKQIAIAAFYEENVGQIPRIKVQLLYMPHIRLQQHMFEQRMQTTYYSWHSTYINFFRQTGGPSTKFKLKYT